MKNKYNLIRYSLPFHFFSWLTACLPDNIIFLKLRGWLLSYFVKSSGKNLQIGRDVTIYNPAYISFGNNVYVAKGCFFSSSGGIEIGDNVLFGPYVVMVTSDHSMKDGAYYFGEPINIGKVKIKGGSWIAAHATVLSKTTIEEGVLVAANAVIRGRTEAYKIYGGVPAKEIRKLDETNKA